VFDPKAVVVLLPNPEEEVLLFCPNGLLVVLDPKAPPVLELFPKLPKLFAPNPPACGPMLPAA
jgi:hypothetical protein